jgi:beta-glucanase (GH16 family)
MIKKLLLGFLILSSAFATIGCATDITSTTQEEVTDPTSTTLNANSLLLHIPVDCVSIEIVDGWVPTWCEEFDYTGSVDATKWKFQVGGGGYGNSELQNYTSRAENAYVDGDKLIITALKETYGSEAYTSAKIWTQGIKNWKYGKFEIRAKVPAGVGTWPAFWMMPKNSSYGIWPKSGEIDILEHSALALNKVLGSIHTEKYNHKLGTQISFSKSNPTLTSEFHTYSMVWNEFSIAWYLDDVQYGKTTFNPNMNTDVETYAAWPFDQEFYLIINLAMGGSMGGTVDPNFVSDTFEIDFVRVYQQDYGINDNIDPTEVGNIQAVKILDSTAYLLWTRATDNQQVKYYHIYLNGKHYKSTSLNILKLKNLIAETDYLVEIEAEDYAGNRSPKKSTTFKTDASS